MKICDRQSSYTENKKQLWRGFSLQEEEQLHLFTLPMVPSLLVDVESAAEPSEGPKEPRSSGSWLLLLIRRSAEPKAGVLWG